jgi:hypothetical protein
MAVSACPGKADAGSPTGHAPTNESTARQSPQERDVLLPARWDFPCCGCHPVTLGLDAAMLPSFKIEPPAFQLRVRFAGRMVRLTRHVPIGDFKKPHPVLRR